MPTTIQTIKEAEERLDKSFGNYWIDKKGLNIEVVEPEKMIQEIKSHITQTLLAVFESELESVPEDEEIGEIYPHIEERAKEAMEQIKKIGINQERERQRFYLTEIINYLKQK